MISEELMLWNAFKRRYPTGETATDVCENECLNVYVFFHARECAREARSSIGLQRA